MEQIAKGTRIMEYLKLILNKVVTLCTLMELSFNEKPQH
jgi:hypothetical protein